MARPRKNETNRADARLIDAFWGLLETTRLQNITVGLVTEQAQLNRTTFYYHFASIEQLADQAIKRELIGNEVFLQSIFDLIAGASGAVPAHEVLLSRTHKAALLIRQGGDDALSTNVKAVITDMWRSILCEPGEELKPGARLIIEYATNGIIGIVSRSELYGEEQPPQDFFDSFVKQNAVFLLERICEAQGTSPEQARRNLDAARRFSRCGALADKR